MDLRVFEAKALAAALTEAGHSVSERTVQRWKAGQTKPKPQDLEAIRRLLDTKEAPRPEWVEGLADDVVMKLVTLLGGPEYPAALELLRERLEGTPLPPLEAHGGEAEGRGPGTAAPPGRRAG